jgi:DNA-binding CsgD family transcriptional regulator
MPHEHLGHFTLTLSERELLPLIAMGEHNTAISANLGITDEALKKRLQRFYDKTGSDRFSAIAWAKDHASCCVEVPSRVLKRACVLVVGFAGGGAMMRGGASEG